jgi:phage terminase small subunit
MGILSSADWAIIGAAAVTYATWQRAVRLLGQLSDDDLGGPVAKRLKSIAGDNLTALIRIHTELGLTPSSRTRIRVPAPRARDELADFLGAANGGADRA